MGIIDFLSKQSGDPLGGLGVYTLVGGCILAIIGLIWLGIVKGEFSRMLTSVIVISTVSLAIGAIILGSRYLDYGNKVEKRNTISEHDRLIYATYGNPTDKDNFESPEIELNYDRTTQ